MRFNSGFLFVPPPQCIAGFLVSASVVLGDNRQRAILPSCFAPALHKKTRWGGWAERKRTRKRRSRRLTPDRTASPCCLNGHISDGEWKQVRGSPVGDVRPFKRSLDAEVRRGASAVADPSREGYLCLRPTGAPTALGDDSGYSHPRTHERPAAAGHRR